jgi:hypothetical protein
MDRDKRVVSKQGRSVIDVAVVDCAICRPREINGDPVTQGDAELIKGGRLGEEIRRRSRQE